MSKPKKAWDDEESHEKKKLLTPDLSSLIVKIIEDEDDSLASTFGITEEADKKWQIRIHQLLEAEDAKDGKKSLSNIMVILSKECTHANELAYVSFALGRITGDQKRDRGSSLAGIVGVNRKTGKITHLGGDGNNDMPDFIKDILRDILNKKKGEDDDKDKWKL
jgi:hypothetical protein